jgi:hypothetical protein
MSCTYITMLINITIKPQYVFGFHSNYKVINELQCSGRPYYCIDNLLLLSFDSLFECLSYGTYRNLGDMV